MATVITVIATCCRCKLRYLKATNTAKLGPKYGNRNSGVLEKLKLIVNAVPSWVWLANHHLNEPAVLLSCATLNLGDISLSRFWSHN